MSTQAGGMMMGYWKDIADTLKRRDDEQVEYTNLHGGATLENRLMLAEGRALDALSALMTVLSNLDEIEAAAPKPDTPVKTYTGGKPNYCNTEE